VATAPPEPRHSKPKGGGEELRIPPGGHRTLRVGGGGPSAAEARRLIHQLLHQKPGKSGGSPNLRNPRQILREVLEGGKQKQQSGGSSEKQGEGAVSEVIERVLEGK
jgi:hypothetical protein